MTPQEAQVAEKIAALMRAARKSSGLTQVAVAARLQISQSALSKVESGFLIPSAPQWFEFCEMTQIAPDSLNSGFLERNTPAVLLHSDSEVGYKIPKAYLENRGTKVRAALPMFRYFRQVMGVEKTDEYFRTIKMDPDMMVDLDEQVSLKFSLDLSRKLIAKGHLKPGMIGRMTESVSEPRMHGSVQAAFRGQSESFNLLQLLLRQSHRYECNFKHKVEELDEKNLVFSVRPEEHMDSISYRNDPALGDFICQYKKGYFERFTYYGGAKGSDLQERECHYKGAPACIYHLQQAS